MIRRCILSALLLTALTGQVSAQQNNNDQAFTIEGYYKAKWGYADEFIALFKKNHYPLLKKALEKSDILSIKGEKPSLHATEESR